MSNLMRSDSSLNIEQLLSEISNLNQELEKVKQEKAELATLVETITEDSDVDRIRLTQQLKEKNAEFQRLNQLKDEFLINTSNQLSTPLEGLVNNAKLILDRVMGKVSPSQRKRRLTKIPLRVILIVPFVVQVVGAVGLVGYLSFRNGQRAVNDLVNQLESSTAQRIEQHTQAYLRFPQQLQRNTQVSIENGELDPNNFDALKRYFLHQLKAQDEFKYFFYGNSQGDFLGVQQKKNKIIFKLRDRTTNQQRLTYELDSQTQPAKLLEREFLIPGLALGTKQPKRLEN